MGMDNSIELAVSSVLKNPILSVLREINIGYKSTKGQILPLKLKFY
jgi:hypothetical protein